MEHFRLTRPPVSYEAESPECEAEAPGGAAQRQSCIGNGHRAFSCVQLHQDCLPQADHQLVCTSSMARQPARPALLTF